MNWSPEQLAIFKFFGAGVRSPQNLEGTGNLSIKARAGTGKTTTIKAAFEHAPENRILYAVFNKRNQKEAEEKINDPRVDVRTLHSLGFAFIKRVWSNAKPDDDVEFDRIEKVAPLLEREEAAAVAKLVGFAKNTTIQTTVGDLKRISEEQDIPMPEAGFNVAMEVLKLSKERNPEGKISFNDMVWLPVACGWVKQWFDLVCIDEAQDMNLPQLVMARGACKTGGRVVVVGDDRQAIYGFRGAAQDGMAMMKTTLRAAELGLTTTYRCPKAVVRIAQEIVPDYQFAPEAPEGEVQEFAGELHEEVKVGDAILSRMNAPLMPTALKLLRKNIPARIEGRDIGRQLIGMVRSMKATSVPNFIEKVNGWEKKQVARLEGSKNAEKKIEQTRDIAETLRTLAQDAKNISDIDARINYLFQDSDSKSKPAVILSTVHKAKGLEWKRVFLLRETFRKGKGAEEDNIWYVAVTRAQRSLFFVGGQSGNPAPVNGTAPSFEVAAVATSNLQKANELAETALRRPIIEDSMPPVGQVRHQIGNVIKFEGFEWSCYKVNDCNASFVCLSRNESSSETLGGKKFTIQRSAKRMNISNSCDPSFIKRKMPKDEVENFLTQRAQRGKNEVEPTTGDNQQTESEDSMATKAKAKNKVAQGSNAGRGELIHSLKAKGLKKEDAWAKVKEKYPWGSRSPFDKAWDSKGRTASAKPEAKGQGQKKNAVTPKGKKAVVKKSPAAPVAAAADRRPAPATTVPPRPSSTEA